MNTKISGTAIEDSIFHNKNKDNMNKYTKKSQAEAILFSLPIGIAEKSPQTLGTYLSEGQYISPKAYLVFVTSLLF